MAIIGLDGVTARIGKHAWLRDISLHIGGDDHWAIVGANGSGKSALGRLLCGELEVDSGFLDTVEKSAFIAFETVNEILEIERYNDDTDFLDRIDQGTSVRDFILEGQPDAAPRLHKLAAQLHFSDLLERGIRFLSTGEMRKVVICRALLQDPELLVLDEPFDGLDQASCQVVRSLISDLAQRGLRLVLLLNRFSEILPCITHLAYLRDCRIFASGPREELLASEALLRFHAFHYALPERLPAVPKGSDAGSVRDDAALVEMKDVMVRYDGKYVLNRLNWTVSPGQHWKISGPNGSGKSTLLSLVSGDNPQAYANDIRLFGRQRGTGESVWDIKKQIGLVSTAFQQSYRVGVTAELAVISGFFDSIGVYHRYSSAQRAIALQWLEILHLQDKRHAPLRSLSYGEQRMVLMARAMIKQPRLLILDEPCQGLDAINREMVLKLVDFLGTRGHTQILYVTHHPEDCIPCITHSLEMVPAPEGGYTSRVTCEAGRSGTAESL
ncbi:ABC transporter, ATP-binding protein [Syntrophotalea carbinolica DSM 2380]|uniref:ABC transporter, ATP-binding protein n=1 Tax=Syntrophotalea carbinolica (strain DSM 2380 / NBRC 103641 / GraBd1) TaxID=338963 RepID=Q3A117_SYNC1|nr:molybdate ABC transporter ATP-binding protein ModF [Syntrophotalea carbinolica]ABA89940.1 ABC transporter, ATP-binding protein [Syntrophotalea carbinolica DSM 2380]